MKKAWKCCIINLQQWKANPKYVLYFVYVMLIMWGTTHGLPRYADSLGYPWITPWLLPLFLRVVRIYPLLLIGFLILICDLPLRTGQQQFVLLRVGKRSWLYGQLLYLLLICLSFSALLWVSSWIFYFPKLEWTSRWGKIIVSLLPDSHNAVGPYGYLEASIDVLKNTNGLKATLWTLGMQTLVCYFLGLLIMLLNLTAHRGLGVFFAAGLILFSFLVRFFAGFTDKLRYLIWISPVSWIDRSMVGHVNQNLPSHTCVVLMTLGLCIILIVILRQNIHKFKINLVEGVM